MYRFNLNFVYPTTVSGNTVTSSSPTQSLAVTTLLPASPKITAQPIPTWSLPSMHEPSTNMMVVEDASKPADVRFLHVLQATDAGVAPAAALLMTGTVAGGGAAHGALFGSTAVLFVTAPPSGGVTSITCSLPAGSAAPTSVYATGLMPGASYQLTNSGGVVGVAMGGGAGSVQADSAGVASF